MFPSARIFLGSLLHDVSGWGDSQLFLDWEHRFYPLVSGRRFTQCIYHLLHRMEVMSTWILGFN